MGDGVIDALSKESVYLHLQALLARQLVLVVGSGASCARGLPGMSDLAERLLADVPDRCDGEALREWSTVSAALSDGKGLEAALVNGLRSDELGAVMAAVIGECIAEAEAEAIAGILEASEPTSFGRLFAKLANLYGHVDVITTNYDRLLEVHAARATIAVDTMFSGHTVGFFDEARSRDELLQVRSVPGARKSHLETVTRPHVRLAKPHGSLNWFMSDETPYRSDIPIPGARRIIAPGGNKYQLGYERPFDSHRARANAALSRASGMLFVGYGFNDSHLETYLSRTPGRAPSAVVTRSLTENARAYLRQDPAGTIGIEAGTADSSSIVWCGDQRLDLDVPLWDLDYLTKEAFAI